MVDVAAKRRHGPVRPGFGHEPRQLARDARTSRQRRDAARPRLPFALRDVRLAAVVDDHGKVGMAVEHAQQRRQLRRLDQRVEAKAEARERRQRAIHVVPQDPLGVGKVLQHRADRFQQRVAREADERRHGIRGREIDPADDALDQTIARARHFEQELGFGNGRRRLHEHGRVDAGGRQQRPQVVEREIAVDRRERRRQPAVVATVEAPDMVMRVDRALRARHDRHRGASPGRGASSATRRRARNSRQNAGGIG